jgi:hypothetical protein
VGAFPERRAIMSASGSSGASGPVNYRGCRFTVVDPDLECGFTPVILSVGKEAHSGLAAGRYLLLVRHDGSGRPSTCTTVHRLDAGASQALDSQQASRAVRLMAEAFWYAGTQAQSDFAQVTYEPATTGVIVELIVDDPSAGVALFKVTVPDGVEGIDRGTYAVTATLSGQMPVRFTGVQFLTHCGFSGVGAEVFPLVTSLVATSYANPAQPDVALTPVA